MKTLVVSNKERIEQIKERESKATKGEWFTDVCNSGPSCWCRTIGNKRGSDALENCIIPGGSVGAVDAEFIAHARQDIPWLLDQLERYEKALEWCKEQRNRFIPHSFVRNNQDIEIEKILNGAGADE